MTVIQDRLVCGVCKGKKIIVNESTGKNDICPKCKGRGYYLTDKELKEEQSGRAKVILHG
ncbi:hypothetical protein HN803_03810 [candidate division WWE3 bacterium]|jgi:hypothetical protein|nr:hypothetical protein [candidate division WWE3 bacterium]